MRGRREYRPIPWGFRVALGLGMFGAGLIWAAGGTLSLMQGTNAIPDIDTRPAYRRTLEPRPRGNPLPTTPEVARFYAATNLVGGLVFAALGLLTLLGSLDRPTRTSPAFLYGLGIIVSAVVIGTLAWDLAEFRWFWVFLGVGGVFQLVSGIRNSDKITAAGDSRASRRRQRPSESP